VEIFASVLDALPWWVAAAIVVAVTVALVGVRGLPPWSLPLLRALRSGSALSLARKRPRLTLAPPPEPLDEHGPQPEGTPLPAAGDHDGNTGGAG
jgi:hypothetical protein